MSAHNTQEQPDYGKGSAKNQRIDLHTRWNEGEKLTSSARSPGDALCALPRQVAPPSSSPEVNHHAASTSTPKVHGIDIPESHWEIDEFCVGDGKIRT